MLRLILLAIVGLFFAVGIAAVALFHFWGWKGLIAFPFVILAFLWLVKIVIANLFKRLALGLFGMKSRALRGAAMNVHSIKSIPPPPEPETDPDADDDDKEDDSATGEKAEATKTGAAPVKEKPAKDYLEIDVTVTPKSNANQAVWEPTELILTSEKIKSLADLANKEVGSVHSLEVWNGTAFGPDDPGKYPGEQRLKIIFAVKPGAQRAWLHYYNEPIGELKLPVGTITV
jgi:hypothetical protein